MIYGKVHNWQGNEAVKQILVFPSLMAQSNFETLHKQAIQSAGVSDASDTNIGAAYKIRAVLTGDGSWVAIVRCGVTGVQIAEDHQTVLTWMEALQRSHKLLRDVIAAASKTELDLTIPA